ncbi:MAG TPA: peptide deformylase [Candidatus Saccharimonas sp.]|jgi:peptide deformylase|nr:peptide deformylase [Candidatus Saccharimonas sp.]
MEILTDKVESEQSLDLVDPVEHAKQLNSRSTEVRVEDITSREVQFVIDEMLRMAAGKGVNGEDTRQMVGLAAPQVGISKRIITIDITATGALQQQEIVPIINPRIVAQSDEMIDGREGCWSCGDFCANVPRSTEVTVEGSDRAGKPIRYEWSGFVARIAQHEVDHLDGVRCIDRVPAHEPWRLHRVLPQEFERYRSEWPHWQQTFPREEWERFRSGQCT